jgi:1-acyl-sn-glycerol-3-phosphate acyltransferase
MNGPLWDSPVPASEPARERFALLRVLRRGVPLVLLILSCLPAMMLVRAVERLCVGERRPVSALFPRFVSRTALRIMGLRLIVKGAPMQQSGAVVANHSSWMDIFSLNACQKIFFVSKAEVAGWPGIGILAKATGTVFISRQRRDAAEHKSLLEERLSLGHKLLFFPEGTSSDSIRILPFKSTLFSAFFAPELRDEVHVQPVTVHYIAPSDQDLRFYGWWGDMDFGPSLLKMLSTAHHGRVEVTFHTPIAVKDVTDRKMMARMCEEAVRSAMPPVPHAHIEA